MANCLVHELRRGLLPQAPQASAPGRLRLPASGTAGIATQGFPFAAWHCWRPKAPCYTCQLCRHPGRLSGRRNGFGPVPPVYALHFAGGGWFSRGGWCDGSLRARWEGLPAAQLQVFALDTAKLPICDQACALHASFPLPFEPSVTQCAAAAWPTAWRRRAARRCRSGASQTASRAGVTRWCSATAVASIRPAARAPQLKRRSLLPGSSCNRCMPCSLGCSRSLPWLAGPGLLISTAGAAGTAAHAAQMAQRVPFSDERCQHLLRRSPGACRSVKARAMARRPPAQWGSTTKPRRKPGSQGLGERCPRRAHARPAAGCVQERAGGVCRTGIHRRSRPPPPRPAARWPQSSSAKRRARLMHPGRELRGGCDHGQARLRKAMREPARCPCPVHPTGTGHTVTPCGQTGANAGGNQGPPPEA